MAGLQLSGTHTEQTHSFSHGAVHEQSQAQEGEDAEPIVSEYSGEEMPNDSVL